MADTVTVTYKVQEDGSLKAIAKDATKAADATKKATGAADAYQKKQKGVGQAGLSGAKAFSKMSGGITDGLVPAYATLAANVFALSAAFGVLSRNDAIAKLQEGLEFTGRAAGRNLTIVADKLQEITANAISAEQAMRTTAVGVSAGFTEQQMEGLARVAKGAAMALGRDLGDAMDRLTRGAAKLEPEILDELGIMVRLDDAVRDYALAVNKSHTELTQFERRMAFTNAIIADGIGKFAALSDALDPSAYAQLSASFSDLTKTFINGLNTIIGPFLKFLADTPVALAALAAAFGASLSGQMLGGLQGMADKSMDASKATQELVGESLKGVTAHEKLGKAFNEVANGATREKKDLDRMMKSLNMTINMTTKDTEKLKTATKARNQLTKEIHLQNIAQAKSTHSNALSTMQTHGLTAAAKIQAQAFRELATAHTTATATTTGFATVGVYARTVTTALAMSVRFLGAAFLTAMPYIAGILMAFSLLSPIFKSLFSDTTKLGKAIDLNNKRFKEFDEVAAQYSTTIGHAKNSTEAWIATLRPVAGLLTEVSTALDTAMAAADADRILRMADATKKLRTAQAYQANAKNSNSNSFLGTSGSGDIKVIQAKAALDRADKFSEEILKKLEDSAVKGASSVLGALDTMKISLVDAGVDGAAALGVLERAQQNISSAFEIYAKSDRGPEAYEVLAKSIKAAANNASSAVNAFESFNETVKKAKELIGDPTATFGVYAKEIDNVGEAIKKINAVGSEGGPTDDQVEKILEAYGKAGKDVKSLEKLKATLIEINTRTKQNAIDQADLAVGQALGVDKLKYANEAMRVAREKADIIALNIRKVAIADTEKLLELQLALAAAHQEEIKAIRDKYNLLGSRASDSGMGAGASAAIAGAGAIKAAEEGGLDVGAAKFEAAKNTLAGVAKDIAAIGPEGALMSTTIESAMNMQTAFSTAFEVMGDKSLDMSTRVQAGLGAASAMISGLAAISKASSDAKVKGIDDEIAAEKKRDGVSSASTAKIKALEAKKLQTQKKAFETQKKMKMAQTAISTASGALAAYTSAMESGIPAPYNMVLGGIMAAAIVAMGAKQMAMISSTSFQGGGSTSAGAAPSTVSVGNRQNSVDLGRARSPSGELGYARGESGTGQGMTNFTPKGAFSGYKHRAGGGYVVGEQGPELFMPDVPGEIVSSGQEMGGATNVTFNINAVDAAGVEDLLLTQRGNIIGMIRESANAHGENFLEGVNTMADNRSA